MLKVNGTNVFENNEFSWHSWSADVLQTPQEVYDAFDLLGVTGKKIVSIRAIGLGYNLGEELIEDYILSKTSESGQECPVYDSTNWHTLPLSYPRYARLDEPLLIVFDDGSRLEIDFSEGSSVRLSKNSIPVDIKPGTNANNFDAAKLFSCCIGANIVAVHVESSEELPIFTGSYGMSISDKQLKYIERIDLQLTSGVQLQLSAFCDYCEIVATDATGKMLEINFADLREVFNDDLVFEEVI